MSKALICVVTGASRGVGRGVALALGAASKTQRCYATIFS